MCAHVNVDAESVVMKRTKRRSYCDTKSTRVGIARFIDDSNTVLDREAETWNITDELQYRRGTLEEAAISTSVRGRGICTVSCGWTGWGMCGDVVTVRLELVSIWVNVRSKVRQRGCEGGERVCRVRYMGQIFMRCAKMDVLSGPIQRNSYWGRGNWEKSQVAETLRNDYPWAQIQRNTIGSRLNGYRHWPARLTS
ncbi:hypothetical protein JB92DRAFT_2826320 [Gautieria morchelliformis]|nr:hypothetical protein JB92DRAFT_2826320 [Gautieria morchelliformis]